MSNDLLVRCKGSNRHEIIQMVESWCIKNKVVAYADHKRYITESTSSTSVDNPAITTTYWTVPDEKERTFFILRWCNQ